MQVCTNLFISVAKITCEIRNTAQFKRMGGKKFSNYARLLTPGQEVLSASWFSCELLQRIKSVMHRTHHPLWFDILSQNITHHCLFCLLLGISLEQSLSTLISVSLIRVHVSSRLSSLLSLSTLLFLLLLDFATFVSIVLSLSLSSYFFFVFFFFRPSLSLCLPCLFAVSILLLSLSLCLSIRLSLSLSLSSLSVSRVNLLYQPFSWSSLSLAPLSFFCLPYDKALSRQRKRKN